MRKLFLSSTGMLLLMSLLMSSVYAEESSNKSEFKQAYSNFIKLSEQGKWAESLDLAKKSYELGSVVYADDPKTIATLSYNYGLNLIRLKNFELSADVLSQTVVLYEKAYGVDAPELIPVLMDVSESLAENDVKLKLKRYTKRALNISKKHYGPESAEHGQLLVDVALIPTTPSRDVKRKLKAGYTILSNTLGEDNPRTGIAAFNLGRFELANEKYNRSVGYFNTALNSFELPDEPSNAYELSTHSHLVKAYEQLGQSDKATKHCLAIGRMTPHSPNMDYQPLIKKAPHYPQRAADQSKEGFVTVMYDVDEQGFAVNAEVIENTSNSKDLAEASLEAAGKFRYAPQFKDGVAVVTKGVNNEFTFSLSYSALQ